MTLARRAFVASTLCALLACGDRQGDAGADASSVSTGKVTTAGACGAPGHECPLQSWMKGNATPPLVAADFERLQKAFERIVELGPPEYSQWKDIARTGAAAALQHDLGAARRSCKQCHDDYRDRYRRELREARLR